nr:MAG TPA: hypothetical protein [Inoviridae sp.]
MAVTTRWSLSNCSTTNSRRAARRAALSRQG